MRCLSAQITMSSFIVGKQEFVKAAGLMYGIEEGNGHYSWEYFMERVRDRFDRCYWLNVLSVNEQYGDSEEPETEPYDSLFEEYRAKGRTIRANDDSRRGMTFEQLRPALLNFFNSVLYQTENEAAAEYIRSWFYTCTIRLYDRDVNDVKGWWGNIEI